MSARAHVAACYRPTAALGRARLSSILGEFETRSVWTPGATASNSLFLVRTPIYLGTSCNMLRTHSLQFALRSTWGASHHPPRVEGAAQLRAPAGMTWSGLFPRVHADLGPLTPTPHGGLAC
jgi:hypothetical protein